MRPREKKQRKKQVFQNFLPFLWKLTIVISNEQRPQPSHTKRSKDGVYISFLPKESEIEKPGAANAVLENNKHFISHQR